ncbi:hypothetical protein RJ639_022892 [Escallonia herrerae]|uniref:Alkyl transferase n=1 Tax=Escallonia herrerae TaxID=1293975 RepID=A0AA88V0W8_9ASTE|nr:hypothetical protein RJ639_022892 [Escallonia herrerae]
MLPNAPNRLLTSVFISFTRTSRPLRVSTREPNFTEEYRNGVVNGRVAGAGAPAREDPLPEGLRRESMPRHVAVIMDGNRRWARARGLPAASGYEAGLRSLRGVVELCCRWGIRVLTVFAFSSDNWVRPKPNVGVSLTLLIDGCCFVLVGLSKLEVDFLMSLFARALRNEGIIPMFDLGALQAILLLNGNIAYNHDFHASNRRDIRVSLIGDSTKLPKALQKLIESVEETTKNNSRLHLVVAVSYSGQYDIVQACQSIALKVKDALIGPEDINEFLIEKELQTNCAQLSHPDLLIRTSGELRLSNFFLWQLAYTELFFAESHWPDFGEPDFIEALRSFRQRQRWYGGQDP